MGSHVGQTLIAFFGYLYIQIIYRTSRWEYLDFDILDRYVKGEKPFIICFWHGRLLMMPVLWKYSRPFKMLLSQHKDGLLISKILKYFNIDPVYGSTKRGGSEAIIELIRSSRKGMAIGITPDGPRGPAFTVSKGTIALAHWIHADLIPVSFATKHRKVLKTWDQFYLPLPFSRGVFKVSDPLPYPQDKKQFSLAADTLKKRMIDLQSQLDTLI